MITCPTCGDQHTDLSVAEVKGLEKQWRRAASLNANQTVVLVLNPKSTQLDKLYSALKTNAQDFEEDAKTLRQKIREGVPGEIGMLTRWAKECRQLMKQIKDQFPKEIEGMFGTGKFNC